MVGPDFGEASVCLTDLLTRVSRVLQFVGRAEACSVSVSPSDGAPAFTTASLPTGPLPFRRKEAIWCPPPPNAPNSIWSFHHPFPKRNQSTIHRMDPAMACARPAGSAPGDGRVGRSRVFAHVRRVGWRTLRGRASHGRPSPTLCIWSIFWMYTFSGTNMVT